MVQEKIEEIRKQARKIMDDFASALGEIKTEEVYVERDEFLREEKEADKPDGDFRKRMLKNAPKTKGECIEAEKGGWV